MTLFLYVPRGVGLSWRALRVMFGAAVIIGAALAFWDAHVHHVAYYKAELQRIEARAEEIRATYPP